MRIVFTILFLAITSILPATDYYVKNGGNDSSSGLDDANAWAHHPWMSTWTGSVVLTPGDIVHMKRGNTWSIANPNIPFITVKQSGISGYPITTTAYGSGIDPVIRISTATDKPVVYASAKSFLLFDHLHVQHYDGTFSGFDRIGFFLEDICHDITFTNNEIDNIPYVGILGFEDCYKIIIGDTTSTFCATATVYSNNIHDFGYAGVILEGVNPANKESHFNVCFNYIHDGTRTLAGDNEYGIQFTATPTSTAWPKYATARYNRVENIKTWTVMGSHGGSSIYFLDNYIKTFGVAGITLGCVDGVGRLTATCDNMHAERNTIEQPISGWVTGNENSFIFQYSSSATVTASNIYIKDNTILYTSKPTAGEFFGIRSENVDGMTISGNKIYNGSTTVGDDAIYLGNLSGTGQKNVIIAKNFISQWGSGIAFEGPGITGSLSITDNIICKVRGRSIVNNPGRISATGTVTIYNNTMIQDSSGSAIHIYLSGIDPGGSLMVRNNIFCRTTAGKFYNLYWEAGTINGILACDYNLYWNCKEGGFYDGSERDWTYWTEKMGFDTHSLKNSDPLFMNNSRTYSEAFDFLLQSTSPAINKGMKVSEVSFDYFGNPRDTAPDIGANEYYVSSQTLLAKGIELTGVGGATIIPTDNGTLQLSADVTPIDATNKSVTWSITNGTGQATISSSGLVTAVANGTVTAKATANDGSGVSGTLVITISGQVIPVTGITVTGAGGATTITTDNGTLQLNAAVTPSDATNKTVTWSITNGTGQASISSSGLVTTITNGTVTAKATANDGSGVSGTRLLTISNQDIPVNPVYINSIIQNATPTIIELNYNIPLAYIVPSASAFNVTVNSVTKTVNSVTISGTKVLLALSSMVFFNDIIKVSYNIPSINPLQSTTGGKTVSFLAQSVTNNVIKVNSTPVIVVDYQSSSYSGFISEISANGSYDTEKDNLTYSWTVPSNVPVSSTSAASIKYLGPDISTSQKVEFTLKVSDGRNTQTKTFPIEILPYKPEFDVAEVSSVYASSYEAPYYPYNVIDGNIGTMWKANGNDQWLTIRLRETFNIENIRLGFQPGQARESYFDILGSSDSLEWQPILNKTASCAFSGDLQVFEFPHSKSGKEYNYIKLIGLGNSTDSWNYVSELKVYGFKKGNPKSYDELPVKIYPNPAYKIINIRIDGMTLKYDFIRIINLSGDIIFQDNVNPDDREFKIPVNLRAGVYVVQMGSGNLTLFSQQLVIGK